MVQKKIHSMNSKVTTLYVANTSDKKTALLAETFTSSPYPEENK